MISFGIYKAATVWHLKRNENILVEMFFAVSLLNVAPVLMFMVVLFRYILEKAIPKV